MTTRLRWTLAAAILGSGIVFLDGTVVTVALPAMGRDLISPRLGVLEAQSYVYNAYLLTLSALLVPAGALTDARGRRRMFTLGLIGFGLTSVLCGLAPTMELLIAGRVLQGAAGALLVPGSLAIITAAFEGPERARAFGLWAGSSAVVAILGPLVGGLLVDSVSWRAVFLVNLPLVGLGWWATTTHVEESRDPHAPDRVDWAGAGLAALAVGGIVLGLIRGQEQRWGDPLAYLSLVVGLIAAIASYLRARLGHRSLIPAALFDSRTFKVVNVTTFLIYGALYVVLYFLTIFLQGTLGYTATGAGVATVPAMVFLALLSERVGKWTGRLGTRPFLAVGPALMAAGVMLLALIPAGSEPWLLGSPGAGWAPPTDYLAHVLPGIVLFGLGAMVMVTPLTEALMGSVSVENAGVASAFNNAVSRVGPQIAGAAIFMAVTAVFYGSLFSRVPALEGAADEVRTSVAPLNRPAPGTSRDVVTASREASADAFGVAMWISSGLLLAGSVINAAWIEPRSRPGSASVSIAGQVCVPWPPLDA